MRKLIIGIYKPSSIMWRSPLSYAWMIWKISMKYKCYFEAQVWIFLKGIVVLLPSLFLFSFFIFIFVASLALSIYLSFVLFRIFSCVIFWDLLFVSSLGSFPHFKSNTLYIQRWTRSTHFYKVLTIKLNLYHDVCNVCLCQCSRICNDTSVSCYVRVLFYNPPKISDPFSS